MVNVVNLSVISYQTEYLLNNRSTDPQLAWSINDLDKDDTFSLPRWGREGSVPIGCLFNSFHKLTTFITIDISRFSVEYKIAFNNKWSWLEHAEMRGRRVDDLFSIDTANPVSEAPVSYFQEHGKLYMVLNQFGVKMLHLYRTEFEINQHKLCLSAPRYHRIRSLAATVTRKYFIVLHCVIDFPLTGEFWNISTLGGRRKMRSIQIMTEIVSMWNVSK